MWLLALKSSAVGLPPMQRLLSARRICCGFSRRSPDGFSSRSSLCSRSPISHPVSGPLTGVISSTSRLVLLRTRWALVHCPMDTPDSSFREISFARRLSMSLHPMMSAVPCLLLDVPRRTADTVGCSVAGYTHVLLANEDDCPSTTDFYVNEG